MIKTLLKRWWPLTLAMGALITLSILAHPIWFDFSAILTAADWDYKHIEELKDFANFNWGMWLPMRNFGTANVQPNFVTIEMTTGWLYQLTGATADTISRFLYFFPILLLSSIGSLIFCFRITRNTLASFVAAILYICSSYFLIVKTQHLNLAFVYALTPITLLVFDNALVKNRLRDHFLLAVVFTLSIIYEPRLTYLVAWILLIYLICFALYQSINRKHLYHLIFAGCITILLNTYWILPMFLGGGHSIISYVTGRELFGNHYMSLTHSFYYSQPFWSEVGATFFDTQPVKFYEAFAPLIAFLVFLIPSQKAIRRQNMLIAFFALITLIGIFFGKQVASPFPNVYEWMYKNFPGFGFFREASKFHFLTSLGYMGLVALAMTRLFEMKKIWAIAKWGLAGGLVICMGMNLYPHFNNDVGFLNKPAEFPLRYETLNKFLKSQKGEFKTLYLNRFNRFIYKDNDKHAVDIGRIAFYHWPDEPMKSPPHSQTEMGYNVREAMVDDDFYTLLRDANVKYIVQPDGNTTRPFVGLRPYFFRGVLKNRKEVQSLDEAGVKYAWEVIDAKPPIYYKDPKDGESLSATRLHNTKFRLAFRNIKPESEILPVVFTQTFNSNWNMYPTEIVESDINIYAGSTYHIDEEQNPEVFGDMRYLLKEIHEADFGHSDEFYRLNSWEINTQDIDPALIETNDNGTLNFDIILFYKTQSYLYLGWLISGLTLLGIGVYFGFLIFRKKKPSPHQ